MSFGLSANAEFVLFGTILFGISSGVLGCFAFLRRRALLGDAIAHAALPGICLSYLVTQTKHPVAIIVGAATTGLLGSMAVNVISQKSRIKEDAAIGLVLSVFFGVGIVLLTYIQHQPLGNQSGLDKFLFGQAASLVGKDVQIFGGLALILLFSVWLAYKELKLIAFDAGFARGIGMPIKAFDLYLTLLIVLVVTAGLQAVGVVLMAAMLITPAAAARQWTDHLPRMLLLAGFLGGLSGAFGTIASNAFPRMPTGPWIVMMVTLFFAISILFAPRRGMVMRSWKARQNSLRIHLENVLLTLYRLHEERPQEDCSIDMLRRYRYFSVGKAHRLLGKLITKSFVMKGSAPEHWKLTALGLQEAKRLIRRHRLWELYLSRYLHLRTTEVHADAEEIEHIITPELEAELEHLLHHPTRDPHDRPIPAGNSPS